MNRKYLKTVLYTGLLFLTLCCSTEEPAAPPPPPAANIDVTGSTKDHSTTGFTLTFNAAVSGLTASELAIDNNVKVTTVTAAGTENKVFTIVTSELTPETTYTVSLAKNGYKLTNAVTFQIPKPDDVVVTTTATNATIAGFTLKFDKAVADLAIADIELTPTATITGVTPVNTENKVFTVATTLTDNAKYFIKITKKGFSINPQPLEIDLAILVKEVTTSLSNVSNTGFTLTFDTAITEKLSKEDISISPSGTISSVDATDDTNKIFKVVTSTLKADTYTITLNKEHYTFKGELSFKDPKSSSADLISLKVGAERFAIPVPVAGATTTLANAPHTLQAAISALSVEVEASKGATITAPTDITSVDFSAGKTVAITITAEDGTTSKTYNIVITPYDATSNPYGVYSPRHLSDIRNALESTDKYILMNDIYLPDTNGYNDTTDPAGMGIADYSTAGWAPIWNGTKNFFGTLDGNGKAIIGLSITRATTDAVGLFRATGSGATIKNLGIITTGSVIGNNWVGIITGNNVGGSTITHCYTKGSVIGSLKGVGGIAGYNDGNILNSYSTASVGGPQFRHGGIVGNGKSGAIINCYSTGDISGDDSIGGIVGYCEMSINTCYSISKVQTSPTNKGGLVGLFNGGNDNIQNSYWDVETSLQPTSPWGGTGQTTAQMKAGIPYNDKWSSDNWIFTAGQYPKLVGVGGQ